MPNIFAYVMLLIWPLIMVVLFKKQSHDRALIWSLLGGMMILPELTSFDFPLVPQMNKHTLPSVMALLLCMSMLDQKIRFFPKSLLASMLMIGFLLSPFATALANREPVFWGRLGLPGLSWRDGVGGFLSNAITLIPVILGFNYLTTAQARRNFLIAFVVALLIYSVPMLIEGRISPQINRWVYGFFPELFGQQVRFDGYRPVVFMGHGLVVAFFTALSVLSAAILVKGCKTGERSKYIFALVYLWIILIFCKSIGSILLAVAFVPVILFLGVRLKGWAILVSAVIVLSYPVLRAADLVPVDKLVGYAALIQEERAGSLNYRFVNEGILLDHAAKKPIAGWGSWNRNRVYDVETGRDIAVPDGHWVIVIGVNGWIGYISVFGLLTLPLLRLWGMRKTARDRFTDPHIVYGIALMLAVNMLDLLPNSTITPMTWLMAGMLLGSSLQSGRDPEESALAEEDTPQKQFVHARRRRGQVAPSSAEQSAGFQRKKR